jgi:hypothetical protein
VDPKKYFLYALHFNKGISSCQSRTTFSTKLLFQSMKSQYQPANALPEAKQPLVDYFTRFAYPFSLFNQAAFALYYIEKERINGGA